MSLTTPSGSPIILDSFGEIVMKAFASADGYLDSAVVTKRYVIVERCQKPIISPNGGTFAGSVMVLLQSASVGTKIYYSLVINDSPTSLPNSRTSAYVMNGQTLLLNQGPKKVHIYALASKKECADSQIVDAVFNILPKVASPVILPDTEVRTYTHSLSVVLTPLNHCDT
jgi:molybdopterin/thiamine biosynthesis adenylyltransferase